MDLLSQDSNGSTEMTWSSSVRSAHSEHGLPYVDSRTSIWARDLGNVRNAVFVQHCDASRNLSQVITNAVLDVVPGAVVLLPLISGDLFLNHLCKFEIDLTGSDSCKLRIYCSPSTQKMKSERHGQWQLSMFISKGGEFWNPGDASWIPDIRFEVLSDRKRCKLRLVI